MHVKIKFKACNTFLLKVNCILNKRPPWAVSNCFKPQNNIIHNQYTKVECCQNPGFLLGILYKTSPLVLSERFNNYKKSAIRILPIKFQVIMILVQVEWYSSLTNAIISPSQRPAMQWMIHSATTLKHRQLDGCDSESYNPLY